VKGNGVSYDLNQREGPIIFFGQMVS